MKHAQIVTTSPDVSPVTTGTPRLKPAPRSAQVLINILVPVQTKPAVAARLVAENIRLVNALVAMNGATVLARLVQVLINIPVPEQVIPAVAARLAVENIPLALALVDMLGTEVLVPSKMLA